MSHGFLITVPLWLLVLSSSLVRCHRFQCTIFQFVSVASNSGQCSNVSCSYTVSSSFFCLGGGQTFQNVQSFTPIALLFAFPSSALSSP
jgi:hypothetical protein